MQDPVVTLDIDWAPDFMIEEIATLLRRHEVRATWFVTHASPAIDALARTPELFELGLHPNFLPGSTHGTTHDEVWRHITGIVPDARALRTHGLYQSSPLLAAAAARWGVEVDVSLFLPRAAHLQPHRLRRGPATLVRLPYFWEDDDEMFEPAPAWTLRDPRLCVDGLRIFDFHPVHLALNTTDYDHYVRLKTERALHAWAPDFVASHRTAGPGPRTLFLEILDVCAGKGRTCSQVAGGEEP